LLGWTGAAPGLRQGPASTKLLHELLEQLAVLRPTTEGRLAGLLDVVPPSTLREAVFIVISTRPINMQEEAEKTARLSGASSRGFFGRVTLLDSSHGDIDDLIQYGDASLAHTPRGKASGDGGLSDGTQWAGASKHIREGTLPLNTGWATDPSKEGP
jgi:hypothetical protein